MSLLDRLLGRKVVDPTAREREGSRLDAKRRHLRGKMSKTQSELRRAWTRFRNEKEPEEKKRLRGEIKRLEAERKTQRKEMMRIASEMKQLGFEAKAGYVHAE